MLINVNGNEYRGIDTVTALYPMRFDPVTHVAKPANSSDVRVAFTVYADDTGRIMWQLDPASTAKAGHDRGEGTAVSAKTIRAIPMTIREGTPDC